MADKEIKITTLTEQQREVLKSKTPFILPDNPSQKGYSASQIKKTMYEPVLLLFDWLKRQGLETKEAVEEINAYLNSIDTGLKDNVETLQKNIDKVDTKLDQTKTELTNEIKRVENAVNTEAMNELKSDLNLLKGQVSSNYITLDNKINSSGTEQKAYTDTKVNELRLSTNSAIEDIYSHISNIGTASFEIVGSVEEVTESNVIYLIKDEKATGNDIYKEYILIDGVATLIGDTTMDVSNLATKDELETRLKKLYVTQTSRDVRFDIVFDLISKATTGLYIVNDFFIVTSSNVYSNFYQVTILSMPSHEIVSSLIYSSKTLPSNLEEIVLNVVKESIEDNSITKNKLSVELQDIMVQLVEVPNNVIAKVMSSTELVQLTDEEFAIFENYENKRYVATLNGVSIFFTPINRQIMDEIDVLILDNPSMWIAIVLDTKQAQKKDNPINSDYNYLSQRVTTNETAIEEINEQLGNINSILDEVNGEVI